MQNVTVYTFFAFGNISGREILMHTAQLGGFEDTNNNGIPDLVTEWDRVINATGAPGTDGIPDNYFESSNVDDLQERLMAAITSILRKSASGTSISVLATSATGEGSVYQAYFFTNDVGQGGANVKWIGYTQGLFIDTFGNFREDTVQDAVLDYTQDLIITTRYDNNPLSPTYKQVLVDKFNDANGDGVADSTTPVITADLKSVVPIWEAGKELALTNWSSRKVRTWVDQDNDGLVDIGEEMDFSTANCTALREYLRYAGDSCAGGSNATNLIEFILGREVTGLRTRMLEVPVGSGSYQVWKLGDPIHSTPAVVAAPKARYDLQYGDATYTDFYKKYRTRRQMVYVGANDGMLHAFNGGYYHKGDNPATPATVEHGWFTKNPTDNSSGENLGAEKWSFVPYQLLPQLQWLARTDYSHVYYVTVRDSSSTGNSVRSVSVKVGNSPPKIVSMPPASDGKSPYEYAVTAVDLDGDHMAYQLEAAPPGMTINQQSGHILWSLPTDQFGTFHVKVIAQDGRGGIAYQEFDLSLSAQASAKPAQS
ncbi:MAG: hypothetical protein HP494_10505 [Nitrospira sp.]|nr:hypothetical protein [Nitrospira sp.]